MTKKKGFQTLTPDRSPNPDWEQKPNRWRRRCELKS